MSYTTDLAFKNFYNLKLADVVPVTISLFKTLPVDDKLAMLWFAYQKIDSSITFAAPGSARLQFVEGLLLKIQQLPETEQLQAIKDIVRKANTQISRSYGTLTTNTKLAFWYQLAQVIEASGLISILSTDGMSRDANNLLAAIQTLDFSQQITVLRAVIADMGIDPFAS